MKTLLTFCFTLLSLSVGAVTITNSNFDSNPGNLTSINPWQVSGTTSGLSVVRSSAAFVLSPLSLRVTGRGAASDGSA